MRTEAESPTQTRDVGERLARALPWLGLAVGSVVAVLALLSGTATGLGTGYFTRETQEILDGPWYVGAASTAGVLLWWTAAVAVGVRLLVGAGARLPLLLALGFSGFAAFDDQFLAHEEILPFYGVPEVVVVAVHTSLFLAWVVTSGALASRRVLLPFLVLALLGMSVVVDLVVTPVTGFKSHFLEDGPKLAGIGLWAGMQVGGLVRSVVPRTPSPR